MFVQAIPASSLWREPLEVLRAMDHHAGEGREPPTADDDHVDRIIEGPRDAPEVCG